jgi:hypothetical protein
MVKELELLHIKPAVNTSESTIAIFQNEQDSFRFVLIENLNVWPVSNQHTGSLAVDGSNGTGVQQPIGQLRMYFCGGIGGISPREVSRNWSNERC